MWFIRAMDGWMDGWMGRLVDIDVLESTVWRVLGLTDGVEVVQNRRISLNTPHPPWKTVLRTDGEFVGDPSGYMLFIDNFAPAGGSYAHGSGQIFILNLRMDSLNSIKWCCGL